ncbi:tyrosine-type recombinase/integrase [Halosimplex halophilum]|uniref:tyrosine-type recombinase/integrase n=1 Tax=Halosimplex halophilum TaxID=2559572 RepID=UPI00107EF17B|nr:tyrosine-type recombinase/integrase [Halosimplex halophilum]
MDLEPISPERAVELYLDHRRNEVANATLRSHRSRLNQFRQWCREEEITNLNELSGRDLYQYRTWRKNEGDLSKVSLKTQLVTLRVFVKWLESIEAVKADLHTKILLPSLSTEEQVRNQMIESDRAEEILTFLRKYEYASNRHLVMELAYTTAMRRGALHSLDVADYYPKERYIEVTHSSETPLKNQEKGERHVSLNERVCELLDDWLQDKRPDVVDDHGRKPLLASEYGRLHPSTIQQIIYRITRPCEFADYCPHDRDIGSCEATERHAASKCPSSIPPHGIRRGAITSWLAEDVPEKVVSDRANVGTDVLEKHYDQRDEHQKMEQRREYSDKF